MTDISIGTLMMSIQAVKNEITRLEELLTLETLSDGADIQDLLLSFEDAAEELKSLYKISILLIAVVIYTPSNADMTSYN